MLDFSLSIFIPRECRPLCPRQRHIPVPVGQLEHVEHLRQQVGRELVRVDGRLALVPVDGHGQSDRVAEKVLEDEQEEALQVGVREVVGPLGQMSLLF